MDIFTLRTIFAETRKEMQGTVRIHTEIPPITDEDTFELTTADVKEVFEGMNLNDYQIISSLKELIHENIGA